MKRFAALVLLTLPALAVPQSKSGEAVPWYCEKADIPYDPRIHLGHLDNGMRFAWMVNHEPHERSYLRLDVDVGSLAEEDNERGMAHFVEHMAFNGSKNFPAGTLVEWFQKHGMGFGADTNASTGFNRTIYQIDLPKSDRGSLAEGLGVLRDFADGLLLEQKEVDSERGVIDAEERERDSPGLRVVEQLFESQYAGTRIPLRIPIGKKAARDAFTPEMLRKFYTKWYRPERMTLILVGDLGELDPIPLVHAAFDGMHPPPGAPAPLPKPGVPEPKNPNIYIYEKDLSTEQIHVERMTRWEERPENLALWKSDLPLRCARGMLGLRFSELAKLPAAPFLGAAAHDAYETDLCVQGGEELSISSTPERWKDALSFCAKELHRALEHGFDASELSEIRADILRSLDEGVEREKTRPSSSWVASLIDAAETPSVPNNAETTRRLMKPMVDALDVEACQKAFAGAWSRGQSILSMAGDVDLGADGPKILRETFDASWSAPVEARKETKSAAFAYATDAAKSGKVSSQKHVDEFDFEEVVFENGVKLWIKKTDFKEKEILVLAAVGEGRLSLDERPKSDAAGKEAVAKAGALEWVASQIFTLCALGKHSADDLRRLNAGKEVGVRFAADTDAFYFSGATTKEDLLRECELIRAHIVDPGFREEGLQQLRKQVPVVYDSLQKQPGGPLATKFLPEFYSHAPRMDFPARENVEAVTTDAMRSWLVPQFKDAPVDVVIVGDVDVAAAVQAVAQTFGTLEKRRALVRYEDRRAPAVLRSGLKAEYEIDSSVPKAFVMILFPATDGRDAAVRRELGFLSQVLQDRLRVEVREKLGVAYSPGAGANLSEVYPDDGWLVIQTEADLGKIDAVVDACIKVANDISEHGITQEELDRQRAPAQAAIRDQLRTNGHWMHVLSLLHSRDHVFEDARTFTTFLDALKPSDLDPLAKKYLKGDRASVAVILPKKSADAPKDAAAPKTDLPPKKKD